MSAMGMEIKQLPSSSGSPGGSQPTPGGSNKSRGPIIGIIIGLIIVIAIVVVGVWALALPTTDTPRIRDIFIIVMALVSLLLGVALIILIAQLAILINLLQNEIKPILESTNETVSTLRGTTSFISDNLVQPVIKINEYVAALSQLMTVIGIARKRKKNP